MKIQLESADKSNKLYTFALIIFAMLFCIAVRLTWVYQFSGAENFKWNDEFMVVTNDSYYFAEGARDIAFCQKDNASLGEYYQKNCHQEFDLSPVNEPLSIITAFLHKILPFSFESIIFYMPAVFSSFIVIPMIILSRRLHMTTTGLMAALFAGIGVSYYNRTMVGYYDTDMLTVFFPILIFSVFALALKTQEKKYIYITGLVLILYRWWYPQGYAIELAFVGVAGVYALIDIFKFKGNKSFYYELFSIIFISMIWFTKFIGIALTTIFFILIYLKKFEKYNLYILIFTFFLFVLYFLIEGSAPVWNLLKIYIFRDSVFLLEGEVKLQFFSVMQTIIESSGTSAPFDVMFTEFARRISVYPIVFIISMIGYIWLCIKKPVFLLMIPVFAIGCLSFSKGIRFSMYAIPTVSFGLAFAIARSSEILKTFLDTKIAKYVSVIFVLAIFSLAIYPLINHAYNYRAGTVFVKDEVALLDDFKTKADREDYLITWWDYGYPLRYYSDIKTLIDGGKHEGAENFPVSFILGADQKSAANMARLDVEYTEKRYATNRDNENKSSDEKIKIPSNNIAWMMKDYNFTNSNDFLLSLQTDIKMPEKTRDVYFYLPFRMIDIYPTILRFSNRDLMNGNEFRPAFWLVSKNFQDSPTALVLEQGFTINKQNGTFTSSSGQSLPLKRYVIANIDNEGKIATQIQDISPAAQHSLVHLKSYNIFLLVDEKMYNSTYLQMFFLGSYDKELFELVSSNPYAKIFKLKI